LIKGWADWVSCQAIYKPYIILRDAKPLTAISSCDGWPQVWLNRAICGIEDELSGDSVHSSDRLIGDYIIQNGLDEPFTFVDSGCWGTIVQQLRQKLHLVFQPLFFYSHNPYIPGYLNSFNMDGDIMETLNDSLECCFPNYYSRPKSLEDFHGISQPVVHLLDGLSARLGKAAIDGIKIGTTENSVTAEQALNNLVILHDRSRQGEFTGILPQHTPTWSKGADFIASWCA
jgi:hypothetical protein